MTVLQISARDPLVLRDGRPNDGRSESRTLSFPLPSTLVGVVRTALGRRNGAFKSSLIPSLLTQVSLRGPLLATPTELLMPAPGDALLVKTDDGALSTVGLSPIQLPDGADTSDIGSGRRLVGIPSGKPLKAKPVPHAPKFWPWSAYAAWLRDPTTRDDTATRTLLSNAVVSLERDERVHVAIGPDGTAEDGRLFVTEGLYLVGRLFDARPQEEREADRARGVRRAEHAELELLVDVAVQDANLGELPIGPRPLGGERRLTWWSASSRRLPEIPAWLGAHVEQGDHALVRVLLLTPAYIESSLGPRRLERPGVAEIVAAKVDRPRTISGWDLAKGPPGGQPKRTRRLADSGSVYWVRLSGAPAERRRWLGDVWMNNLSDDPQLARDGFGLSAVGIGRAS